MNPNQPSEPLQPYNPLEVMSPGERVVCVIKRHPFGLMSVYFGAAVIIILLCAGAILLPTFSSSISTSARLLAYVIAIFGTVLVLLFTYIAATVYNGNRWVVTSDSITQMNQVGLFKKQTSQLSLANLEDVTFTQDGLIPTMMGFGVLRVETAGERSKFTFPFCPRPAECARNIIKAHEDFIQSHPEEGTTVMPGSIPPQGQNQPQQAPQTYQQPVYQQPVSPPAPNQIPPTYQQPAPPAQPEQPGDNQAPNSQY